ncbi:hypothetical protein ACOMHN_037148 [Nucella lapillus]
MCTSCVCCFFLPTNVSSASSGLPSCCVESCREIALRPRVVCQGETPSDRQGRSRSSPQGRSRSSPQKGGSRSS